MKVAPLSLSNPPQFPKLYYMSILSDYLVERCLDITVNNAQVDDNSRFDVRLSHCTVKCSVDVKLYAHFRFNEQRRCEVKTGR